MPSEIRKIRNSPKISSEKALSIRFKMLAYPDILVEVDTQFFPSFGTDIPPFIFPEISFSSICSNDLS